MPDLVVIDGGKGQLGAARDALVALGLEQLPLISLAKREEEVFMPGRSESLRLSRRSPALRLLQQARDEAHRFAITYNRQRRTMRTVTSELLQVPGIGPAKRRLLLSQFGSVQGVRDAGVEAIATLPGFSLGTARRLLDALARSAPTAPADVAPPTEVAQPADAAGDAQAPGHAGLPSTPSAPPDARG